MNDVPSQDLVPQSEQRTVGGINATNLALTDMRDSHVALTDRTIHSYPFLAQNLGRRRRLGYGLTLGVPLLLLGVLTLGLEISPLMALVVSALAYAGLFLLFIWQPQIEVERQTIDEDIKKSLAESRLQLLHIRDLALTLRPMLVGTDGTLRLERIDGLAAHALAELDTNPRTSLGTADQLESRLSEFSIILELFQKTTEAGKTSHASLSPLGKKFVEEILPPMERWLGNFSTSLGAENALNFDIAMRVMRDTLESEGMSRTE